MAVELAEVLHPDIVLMDINMPNMDGITAIRIIAQRHPDVHVVGLSIYRAEERADEMIKAGAKAYVSKTALFPHPRWDTLGRSDAAKSGLAAQSLACPASG